MSVIGVDIGTSAVKAGLFSASGELLREASRPANALRPEAASGWRSADAEAYVRACGQVLVELMRSEPSLLAGDPLRSLSVSGNGPTLVPVAADGRAAGDSLLWTDRRAALEAESVTAAAGLTIDPAFYLPKAIWLLGHQEALERPASWVSPLPEYVAWRLCGVAHAVLPDSRFAPFIWDSGLLDKLGLPRSFFPKLISPGTDLGRAEGDLARDSLIPSDCRVIAGLPDFLAAQLGSGCVRPGLALDRAGSSEVLNLCAEKPFPDRRIFSLPHAVAPLWNLSGGLSTSGTALDWLSSVMAPGCGIPPEEELRSAGSGSGGLVFLPYLAGERAPLWDTSIRGAFVGLDTVHGKRHLFRAVMESVAFALRDVMEILEERGFTVEEVRVTGGPSDNEFWCGLKALVLGRPVSVPAIGQAELLGSAALCLTAEGRYSSPSEAAAALYRPRKVFMPPERPDPLIEAAYASFLVARASLASVSRALSSPDFG